MLVNAFAGHKSPPADADLSAALGPTRRLWDQLVADLTAEYHLTPEWNSYSPKAGWSLRLKRDKRNILYLIPSKDAFQAAFVLGDKAVESARHSKLPKSILGALATAKRYAEGTALRIDIAGPKDLPSIRLLAAIKLQ